MKGIKVRLSREVWHDHTDRLYNAVLIPCRNFHRWYEKCGDCRMGKRHEMPMVHIDGVGGGLVYDIKDSRKVLVTVTLSPEALNELLSDCDYFADALDCGVLDSDIAPLARKMRAAAASIRKQLAKVTK